MSLPLPELSALGLDPQEYRIASAIRKLKTLRSPKKAKTQKKKLSECLICFEWKRTDYVLSCKHKGICIECLECICKSMPCKCPFCRAEITNIVKN